VRRAHPQTGARRRQGAAMRVRGGAAPGHRHLRGGVVLELAVQGAEGGDDGG
jgi:hypothetical protein